MFGFLDRVRLCGCPRYRSRLSFKHSGNRGVIDALTDAKCARCCAWAGGGCLVSCFEKGWRSAAGAFYMLFWFKVNSSSMGYFMTEHIWAKTWICMFHADMVHWLCSLRTTRLLFGRKLAHHEIYNNLSLSYKEQWGRIAIDY